MGVDGLVSTMNILDNENIVHFGAGMNLEEASKPAIFKIADKTIAIFAYCQIRQEYMGYVSIATNNSPGVNPFEISKCEQDIQHAKKIYDFVFIMPHWGKEYEHFPLPEIVEYSKRIIKAGADGVFGSHTHQIQPMVLYRCKPIAFSMGNFLFPDYYMEPPRPLWYPPEDCDTSGFERFEYYPGHIEKPCVQVWRPLSRIGMIVGCSLNYNKSITSQFQLLKLNEQNILCSGSELSSMIKRMKWMGKVVMMCAFPILRRLYYSKKNIVRRGYHYLSRKL
jgi:poly-gamma-glutamate synthesis protein (capsule biosynthesis protein)